MPHATAPSLGFQALILCGPGASLGTFTSSPKDFPKALVPIANRPMVWYPLDWCYRMGITDIHLIVPPESAPALEAAMSQNPHLTSLPAPRPNVLAPEALDFNTSTAEIFRLSEVQTAITGHFVVLPCDLVCELDGLSLAEAWMTQEGWVGHVSGLPDEDPSSNLREGAGNQKSDGRRGLSVWYQTKGEGAIKGQETDFVATTPLPVSVVPNPEGSLRNDIAKMVYAMPTDSLKDLMDERTEKGFRLRHQLLKKHGRVKMYTTHRDAHIYFFPYWVARMMWLNDKFDSVAEDVVGWWAKAGWQDGLGDKLKLREGLFSSPSRSADDAGGGAESIDEEVDVLALSSTQTMQRPHEQATKLASRAQNAEIQSLESRLPMAVPPMLAYVQPTNPDVPFIRRVDTAHLLLSVSLRLAKFPSVAEEGAHSSPFAHSAKVPESTHSEGRIDAMDSLIAENVSVGKHGVIKESVIGASCSIGEGAKLTRCLLMDGAVVGAYCQLTGCILGRRCLIEGGERMYSGDRTHLKDCEVQEGYVVPWETDAKNEKFMVFEGLSDEDDPREDALDEVT